MSSPLSKVNVLPVALSTSLPHYIFFCLCCLFRLPALCSNWWKHQLHAQWRWACHYGWVSSEANQARVFCLADLLPNTRPEFYTVHATPYWHNNGKPEFFISGLIRTWSDSNRWRGRDCINPKERDLRWVDLYIKIKMIEMPSSSSGWPLNWKLSTLLDLLHLLFILIAHDQFVLWVCVLDTYVCGKELLSGHAANVTCMKCS